MTIILKQKAITIFKLLNFINQLTCLGWFITTFNKYG